MVLSWCPLKGANATNLLLFDLSVDFIRNILPAQYIYIYIELFFIYTLKSLFWNKKCAENVR